MKRKHPIQPIGFDDRGVIRFTQNKIVRYLLDQYEPGLNDLVMRFGNSGDEAKDLDDRADYEQLMMLIGYSVSGFGDLDLDRRTIAIADQKAARLWAAKQAEKLVSEPGSSLPK